MALADRLTHDAPKVRAKRVGAPLVSIMAGRALLEDLLAGGRIGARQVESDRLLGFRTAFAFDDYALDRVAHLFRTFFMEGFAGDDRGSKSHNTCEQHPASDGVETVVHESPIGGC